MSATSSLLSGRRDVIVVSSVSCLYGIGNPDDFNSNVIEIRQGQQIVRNVFLRYLVDSLYVRNDIDLLRGNFRVKGDTIDIYLAYTDFVLRVVFWGNEIDEIMTVDPINYGVIERFDAYRIFPASIFVTTKERIQNAIHLIEYDRDLQADYFRLRARL